MTPRPARRAPQRGETGYDRLSADAYFTRDPWVTEALLDQVSLRGGIWECACGAGHMARVLRGHDGRGYRVRATDLHDHGHGVAGVDFLRVAALPARVGAIVTNPPWSLGEAFARHALGLTRPARGQVALLLPYDWDAAGGRVDLVDRPPFRLRLGLTVRPSWFDDNRGNPRRHVAWYVWDWRHEGPGLVGYGPIRGGGACAR